MQENKKENNEGNSGKEGETGSRKKNVQRYQSQWKRKEADKKKNRRRKIAEEKKPSTATGNSFDKKSLSSTNFRFSNFNDILFKLHY